MVSANLTFHQCLRAEQVYKEEKLELSIYRMNANYYRCKDFNTFTLNIFEEAQRTL